MERVGDSTPSDYLNEEENVQLAALEPNLQTWALTGLQDDGGGRCWSGYMPVPFERASKRSWWDPTFDSEVLEEQFRASSNPHIRYKFR